MDKHEILKFNLAHITCSLWTRSITHRCFQSLPVVVEDSGVAVVLFLLTLCCFLLLLLFLLIAVLL